MFVLHCAVTCKKSMKAEEEEEEEVLSHPVQRLEPM
jgi:hypothetical protein